MPLSLLISAWRASWKEATRRTKRQPNDVRWVAPVHQFWARPELVVNPALNGTKLGRSGLPVAPAPTVLLVASEDAAAAEFRLATVEELAAVYREQSSRPAPAEQGRRFGVRSI